MADIPVSFFEARKIRTGTSVSSPPTLEGETNPPVNPPGNGPSVSYLGLTDTKDSNYNGKNGFVPVVTNEDGLTLMPIQNSEKDGLINPGVVQWTGIGYDFNVSSALARFQSVVLNSNAAVLSLTTPDATNDRIDLFILQILFDGDGIPNGMEADFITGTPAGSPVKPQIDPATQIELTQVTVTAASSTPTLTEEVIYDENIEWTGSSSGTGTVAFNSAANPFQGSLSIEATNIQNGLKIRLTDGSDYDLSGVQTLGMQLDLKAQMFAGQNIGVAFLDSTGAAISTELTLNFDKISTDYQFIGIALSQFSFTSFLARSIEFRYIRTKGATVHSGFFLDIIKLEGGINPPQTVGNHNQLQGLQGGNATERYHTNKDQNDAIVGANSPSSSNVFATMADVGGGGSAPVAASYANQAAMIAAQGSQVAQYLYYDATEYWEYLGTTAGTIADYRAVSVGGTDPNAVHYNAADGKTASEQEQARVNINSVEQPHMTEVVTGAQIDDLARTSKFIVFTGTNATNITGIASGADGDILNIYCGVTNGIVLLSQNVASVATNRFDFNAEIRVGLSINLFYYNNRWRHFNSGSYINKANADISYNTTSYEGAAAGAVMLRIRQAGVQTAQWNAGGNITSTGITCTTVSASGIIIHARSNASDRSIRRDEKFLNTFENIATAGSINNQAITAGVFAQRFTAATELTGSANGENGRELTIFNNTGGNLTLRHESASSTAANRYYIIGAADLTIPDRGIATLIYTANSRWELKSKNF